MELDYINAFLFTSHIALLLVKIWLGLKVSEKIILLDTPKIGNKMLVFKKYEALLFIFIIATIVNEIYFIFVYFVPMELFIYELIAVLDQILLSAIMIYYLTKGGQENG